MINIKFPITKSFQSTKKSGAKDIIFNIAIENGKEVPIVKLKSGHVYTLYGNNGIGKTTFMNILSLLTESNEPYYHSEGQFYYGFTDGKTTDEIQGLLDEYLSPDSSSEASSRETHKYNKSATSKVDKAYQELMKD